MQSAKCNTIEKWAVRFFSNYWERIQWGEPHLLKTLQDASHSNIPNYLIAILPELNEFCWQCLPKPTTQQIPQHIGMYLSMVYLNQFILSNTLRNEYRDWIEMNKPYQFSMVGFTTWHLGLNCRSSVFNEMLTIIEKCGMKDSLQLRKKVNWGRRKELAVTVSAILDMVSSNKEKEKTKEKEKDIVKVPTGRRYAAFVYLAYVGRMRRQVASFV